MEEKIINKVNIGSDDFPDVYEVGADWTHITNTPTTIEGYGITDACTVSNAESLINKEISKVLGYMPAKVEVSTEGRSKVEAQYITIDGVEYKLVGGKGGAQLFKHILLVSEDTAPTARLDVITATYSTIASIENLCNLETIVSIHFIDNEDMTCYTNYKLLDNKIIFGNTELSDTVCHIVNETIIAL